VCRYFSGIVQCTPALKVGDDCLYDTDCPIGADCDTKCIEAIVIGDACDDSLQWWVCSHGEHRAAGVPFGQLILTMATVSLPVGCVV
jgi:hypothetical protein